MSAPDWRRERVEHGVTVVSVRCEWSGKPPAGEGVCPWCGYHPFMITNWTLPEHSRRDFTEMKALLGATGTS